MLAVGTARGDGKDVKGCVLPIEFTHFGRTVEAIMKQALGARSRDLPIGLWRHVRFGLLLAPFALACSTQTAAPDTHSQLGRNQDFLVRVTLPGGVSASDLEHPSAAVRRQLDAAVAERLSELGSAAGDVIVFEDAQSNPVLPDADGLLEGSLAAIAANELTFTYDSPDDPWTADELASLQGWLNACYPIAKEVYGPPAFTITVNVVRVVNQSVGARYVTGTNEMWVSPSSGVHGDVLCHELMHAFRDDFLIYNAAWEEGMARAAEVEVTQRAGIADPWNHQYTYDVYYEELNRPAVGSGAGNVFAGWSQTLLRYQLAGYAWAKAMLEDSAFFPNFNASYYARAAVDSSARWSEPTLIGIASSVKPSVEDRTFADWYDGQGVLDANPPPGDVVYVRVGSARELFVTLVSVFSRDASGSEANRAGVSVQWTATDGTGAVIRSATPVTNAYGNAWIDLWNADLSSFSGPVKITATATPGSTPITATAFTTLGSEEGVFGIVTGPGGDAGSVTLTPLDRDVPPVTVAVAQGTFGVPALLSVEGRITHVFREPNGATTHPRTFTKDDARYFLHLDVTGIPPAPTGLSAAAGDAQASLSWTASPGATSYDVLRSTTSGSGYALVQSGITTTSATDTGLSNGTTYYYVVQAVSSTGISASSGEARVTPSAATPCAHPIAVPQGTTSVTLNTTNGACYKVAHFTIQGWTCSSWNGRTISANGGAPSQACGFAVVPWSDGAYYFAVSGGAYAWAAFNWWGISNPGVPAPPTGVTAMPGDARVSVVWTASAGATSYEVLRSTSSGGGTVSIARGVTATSHLDTGLVNGTAYYYVVRAVSPGGTSANSSEVTATPNAAAAPCIHPVIVPSGTTLVSLGTQGAACFEVTREIHGWGCSNWDGRTLSVNGATPSSGCGFTIAPWFDGSYYFDVGSGAYPWAALYWW